VFRKPIVFLSDFGLHDPYVGIVKGVIHAINPSATIIDLTHAIEPQNIKHGAFILNFSYMDFPRGAIFLSVIDPGVGGQRAGLILECSQGYFVGPDNGLFGPIIKDNQDAICFKIDPSLVKKEAEKIGYLPRSSHTFHARDIFAPVAALLNLDIKPDSLGSVHEDPVLFSFPVAEIKNNAINGQVIYIDHFGNAITNIPYNLLIKLGCPLEALRLSIKPGIYIPFAKTYSFVGKQQPLFLPNSFGLIEIALNCGSAEKHLNLNIDTKVTLVCMKKDRGRDRPL